MGEGAFIPKDPGPTDCWIGMDTTSTKHDVRVIIIRTFSFAVSLSLARWLTGAFLAIAKRVVVLHQPILPNTSGPILSP